MMGEYLICLSGCRSRVFKAMAFVVILSALWTGLDVGPAMAGLPSGLIQVRAEVSESGIYRIESDALAQTIGVPVDDVRSWISGGRYQAVNMGERVDTLSLPDGGGFYFYGRKLSNQFTDTNIYWLNFFTSRPAGDVTGDGLADDRDVSAGLNVLTAKQSGNNSGDDGYGGINMARLATALHSIKARALGCMGSVAADIPGFSTPGLLFHVTAHAEEDRYDMTADANDPDVDYWFWDVIFAGDPQKGTLNFKIKTPGASPIGDDAILTVYLKGAVNVPGRPDHHVNISLNGNFLGEGFFDGTESYVQSFSFDPAFLSDGENTVSVTGLLEDGVAYSAFAVDSFELSYSREYRAQNDALAFFADKNDVIRVDGFTNDNILLFDVSDPVHPLVVDGAEISATGDGFSLSFVPAGPDTRYFAVRPGAVLFPGRMTKNKEFADLKHQSAQYLVIAPERLVNGAARLAQYRTDHGLTTFVVRLSDVFDQFSYGLYNPHAIHDFIAYASENWDTPPAFVVLVGDGTYDYKDILGAGDNCIPVLMKATPYGLAASDFSYTDIDDDDVPDIPIGRIPVSTPAALDSFINRIEAHEARLDASAKTVIMVADKKDQYAGDFPSDSDALAQHVLLPYDVEKIYLSQLSTTAARQELINAINSDQGHGAFLVNYIGHGGITQLSSGGVLRDVDAAFLTNGPPYPLLVTMTCIAGQFQNPGYPSLSEAMLTADAGGFSAAFVPSGLSLNVDAVIINRYLFDILFSDRKTVIGPAVLAALQKYVREGNFEYMRWIYNLLGDPAMRVAR